MGTSDEIQSRCDEANQIVVEGLAGAGPESESIRLVAWLAMDVVAALTPLEKEAYAQDPDFGPQINDLSASIVGQLFDFIQELRRRRSA